MTVSQRNGRGSSHADDDCASDDGDGGGVVLLPFSTVLDLDEALDRPFPLFRRPLDLEFASAMLANKFVFALVGCRYRCFLLAARNECKILGAKISNPFALFSLEILYGNFLKTQLR
jgi:hypothetical protein